MKQSQRQPSFKETVESVRARPKPAPDAADEPGLSADGVLMAPGGQIYRRSALGLSEAAALEAAEAGALVAWDPCGCGGYCGLAWFDRAAVERMVGSGRPRIRHTKKAHGSIDEYRSDAGDVLLLAVDAVRWGDLLA